MTEGKSREEPLRRKVRWLPVALSILIALLFGVVIWGYIFFWPTRIGPEQPIPFSHRVHVHVKKISCLMCHDDVIRSSRAGIPPLETCMLCHSRIIVTYPPIRKLRGHYDRGEPVLWEKVYNLPDFVYFNHAVHIHRSIDCSRCHGNVSLMDRIELAIPHTMGFCIGCHRETGATTDCFTCHR